ncbi:MAG: hypothetical protein NC087_01615 [Anaeroplasma bactoclasticum]|nr:hypothetical protein [Anaeroplasma bactoclasticum]
MRGYNVSVSYAIYIKDFENSLIGAWAFGKKMILVSASSMYEAIYKANAETKKSLYKYNRYQDKALNNNEIYFDTKILF